MKNNASPKITAVDGKNSLSMHLPSKLKQMTMSNPMRNKDLPNLSQSYISSSRNKEDWSSK